jgi:membrane-bound serine protease (ClpP class)
MVRRALLLMVIVVLGAAFTCAAQGVIDRLVLDGSINPMTQAYVERGIREAEAAHAAMLVIELNTPGGLGESMRQIVMAELASKVPIVVYVAPAGARAASAGTLITLAATVAAMAPGTNIGAAHPVDLLGTGSSATENEKVLNDAVAFAKSVAQERGRNVTWAEKAISASSSLTATEALDQGVIDLVAANQADLLKKLDGYALPDGSTLQTAGVPVRDIKMTLRERFLGYLADPNLVYILFILGLFGLVFELFHPGIGFGLITGVICLTLAFFGMQLLPVNALGVILVLFGVGLMVADAFTPTHGVLTAGGVISLVIGSLTLFDIHNRAIGLSWATIGITVGAITALFVFVISKGLLIQRKRPHGGLQGLVGETGTARSVLNPGGRIFIHGEYWTARSLEGRIAAGERVVVDGIEGRILLVRRAA